MPKKKPVSKNFCKNIIRISCQKARVSAGDRGIRMCKGVMATGQEKT